MIGRQEFPAGPRRLLGLDIGDRRIGVAVSDPTGLLATPLEVYRRRDIAVDVAHLTAVARQEEAEGLVVGLPVNMNGTEGPQAEKVRAFARELETSALPILFWDERLSTMEADRRMQAAGRKRKRGVVQHNDAEAAAVILESYLDRVRPAVSL